MKMDKSNISVSLKMRPIARMALRLVLACLFLFAVVVAVDLRMKLIEARDILAYSFAVARTARVRLETHPEERTPEGQPLL